MNDNTPDNSSLQNGLSRLGFDLPWLGVVANIWEITKRLLSRLISEGIYEVLDYQCTVELRAKDGKLAVVRKQERVRYLQDYVIAYEDQAWGDGKILLDYHCSPGIPVDQYQLGHKTYKLISLRAFRNRDDVDDFNIQWKMRNGFLKRAGFWGTSINHRTKKIMVKIIFPKNRPPLEISITESNVKKTSALGKENQRMLPDGRAMIIWENTKPRLYEDYILRWTW
jgi:hypothetical protein